MQLNFKKIGEGKPILILHGLFGMLDNWQYIANQLSTVYSVYLIDLRNHGRSGHNDSISYESMANDILDFCNQENLLEIGLIGHSMGGKVAMKFAQNYPEYVEKLVVIDISPKYYPIRHDSVLDALQSVDFKRIKTRKDAENQLKKFLHEEDTIQFLLKSLYWKEAEQLSWRFNLPVIAQNIEKIGDETKDRQFLKPTLFIKGELSNYITHEDEEDIRAFFPNSQIYTILNCGHWVHAEKPKECLQLLTPFFS